MARALSPLLALYLLCQLTLLPFVVAERGSSSPAPADAPDSLAVQPPSDSLAARPAPLR